LINWWNEVEAAVLRFDIYVDTLTICGGDRNEGGCCPKNINKYGRRQLKHWLIFSGDLKKFLAEGVWR
jgi:hypothetical protein